jgi:hypothetical protein
VATKNLARTIVEGGRSTPSKVDRRTRNRRERRLRFDTEGNEVSGRLRVAGGKGFADRLAPLERWLERNLGRGWSNVYRDFCGRFDRRTMKGWHLDEHLLALVGKDRYLWRASFIVDDRGILRRRPHQRWGRAAAFSVEDEARARVWAAERQLIVHGDAVFWTARAIDSLTPTSPQGRRLTPNELGYWSSLPEELRRMFTYDAQGNRRRGVKCDAPPGALRADLR